MKQGWTVSVADRDWVTIVLASMCAILGGAIFLVLLGMMIYSVIVVWSAVFGG